jgi:hypothetical protein
MMALGGRADLLSRAAQEIAGVRPAD